MVKRLLLALVFTTSALANDLIVDPRTLRMNDLLSITLSLEGDAARADEVAIPLQNLAIVGEPSVSSEFAWINGETIRRKIFRYRARPLNPGAAVVGPVVVGGQRLGPVGVQVTVDRASGSNDPAVVLRELVATGRDPLFVVASIDKRNAVTGEQVVVTWTLYNAASVQQWQIVAVPKLEDFWSEELDVRNATPEQVFVGDVLMQRVPVRRVALFPLRSGRLRLGGMTIEAAIMRRIRGGPLSMFEGSLVETSFTSAPVELDVQPLPPGPPVAATGAFAMQCTRPAQRNGGPVVVSAQVTGRGNLRGAAPPRFAVPVDGQVQVEEGKVTVSKETDVVTMSRRWSYLIFPARSGMLTIPELTTTVFDPAAGERRTIQCEQTTLLAEAAGRPSLAAPAAEVQRSAATRRAIPRIALGILAALIAGLGLPRLRRDLRLRRRTREILGDGTPAGIRQRVDEQVDAAALLAEPSERGDAYRAVRSILDAAEQERDIAAGADREIARRVRELLTTISG